MLKSSDVHVRGFSACWSCRRAFLIVFLREFKLRQKSKIFNLGAILFQRELDLETKLPAGVSVIMVVSFLFDILY